jgi:hypothetical protein
VERGELIMLDRKKVANLRLALIRANLRNQSGNSEGELLKEIRPLFGELLALADAALKIRMRYKSLPLNDRVMVVCSISAMRDLDELEGLSHV